MLRHGREVRTDGAVLYRVEHDCEHEEENDGEDECTDEHAVALVRFELSKQHLDHLATMSPLPSATSLDEETFTRLELKSPEVVPSALRVLMKFRGAPGRPL